MGLFLFEKAKLRKMLLLGMIFLCIYCTVYTFSRGAYAAILAGFLFIGLAKERRILIAFVIFLIFWRSFVPISVRERIDMTKTESGELEDSAAIRIGLWHAASQMFQESPLVGQGFGTFQFEYKGQLWKDTHNFYLKMLAEQGIIGFMAFLFLLFSSFIMSLKLFRRSNEPFFKGIGLGFAACVVSAAVTNLFGDRWSYLSLGSYFWIFLGLVNRAYSITLAEAAIKNKNEKRK